MTSFQETGIGQELLSAVEMLGFTTPTPIQAAVIPEILNSDRDIIALAQTGTGKTAAFGLPVIEEIDIESPKIQALILSPTRELAVQISKDMKNFAGHYPQLKIAAVYGGASVSKQIKELKKGVHIVVGTPGRILDLLNRKQLKIHEVNRIILDEADEMLNMGFKEELDSILSQTPSEKQTLLFSATMPSEVYRIAENYMLNPLTIKTEGSNMGADNILHYYCRVKAQNRYEALKRIADMQPDIYAIVFCRTRRETAEVSEKLISDGYNADALHGDLSQAQRDNVMGRFRSKHLQMLVATDVAARGLDVESVSHVINYNLPDEPEAYIHRTGRTGRAGKEGISLSITHARDGRKLKQIEKRLGKKIEYTDVPKGEEICEKQLFNLIDKVKNESVNPETERFMPRAEEKLEGLSREDLLKRFVSLEFKNFLDYYSGAGDINLSENERARDENKKSKKKKKGRGGNGNMLKMFVNAGKKHKMKPAALIDIINKSSELRNARIGKIEVLKNFSFFEIEAGFEEILIDDLTGYRFRGTDLAFEIKASSGKKKSKKNTADKQDVKSVYANKRGHRKKKKRR